MKQLTLACVFSAFVGVGCLQSRAEPEPTLSKAVAPVHAASPSRTPEPEAATNSATPLEPVSAAFVPKDAAVSLAPAGKAQAKASARSSASSSF